MDQKILTQILGVSHRNDSRGHEGLIYSLAPLVTDSPAAEPVCKLINVDVLQRHVEAIRQRVEDLLCRARANHGREGTGIEPEADALATHILPDGGFVSVLPPGIHPCFDIVYDAAAQIPWEVLEERYFICRCPHCKGQVTPAARGSDATDTMFCKWSGEKMTLSGGKLAIGRHLAHLVRGGRPATSEGNEFLIVEDPTEDLCGGATDPEGKCARHLIELRTLLQQHGYRLNLLKGRNATLARLLAALRRPTTIGLYYFGHGFSARNGDQGCLMLSDGLLYASELETLELSLRFAFLNACEGAAEGRDWTLEKKFRSVGHALARGGPAKTVIAPLWPVINVQAAQAALDFFRLATVGENLGNALREARCHSFARYQNGVPDISWMAYRYFGDCNRLLPLPQENAAVTSGVSPTPRSTAVFDSQDKLDSDLFMFSMEDVLLRAAKRRNLQGRSLVTRADFLAGMVRVGNLTRLALRQHGIDPDHLYEQICGELDGESSPAEDLPQALKSESATNAQEGETDDEESDEKVRRLRQLLTRWIVRDRREFSPPLQTLLARAEEVARGRTHSESSTRISEQDMLGAFTEGHHWAVELTTGLPSTESMRHWLALREEQQLVDENGLLLLSLLSSSARHVIEVAHILAQQRGACPIPNRLMLAALLIMPEGCAGRAARRHGTDARSVAAMLIAATDTGSPKTFLLGPEACVGVVLPMLQGARQLQAEAKATIITEGMLLRAYCDVAPKGLKDALKSLPPQWRLDLDAIAAGDLEETSSATGAKAVEEVANDDPSLLSVARTEPLLDTENANLLEQGFLSTDVRRILIASAQYAALQGYCDIRSPHLCAALIGNGSGAVSRVLRRLHVSPDQVIRTMLLLVPPKASPKGDIRQFRLGPTVQRLLEQAIQRMHENEEETVSERMMREVLFSDSENVVSKTLKVLGLANILPQLIAEVSLPDTTLEKGNGHVLSVFGTDLTEKAGRGQLVRIVGRNREIMALQQDVVAIDGAWLLLVGEPGVGKRAIVEGLAEWIVDGLCPSGLRFRRVFEICATALLTSTRFPSELEDRVANLLRAVGSRDILFISNLHLLLAGGGLAAKVCQMIAESAPAVISTMTLAEYEQAMGTAGIFRERLRVHRIEPPSRQVAAEMTSVHQELLELEYEVSIAPGAIDTSVDLFPQVFSEKASPGGAIELLRQGCVYVAANQATDRSRNVDAEVISKLASNSAQMSEGQGP